MDAIFLIGLIGSLALVIGAAWPEIKDGKHPIKSAKNWLFAIGGAIMLLYALFNYYSGGGTIFFVMLEVLIVIASVLMMLGAPDKVDVPIIASLTLGLIVWSFFLFENYNTLFFILGLSGISLGYALEMDTLRRSVALTFGSVLIALFSYIEASWIFFWLNLFFALFSAYYLVKTLQAKK